MKSEGRIQTGSRGNWGQQDIQGWPLPGPFCFPSVLHPLQQQPQPLPHPNNSLAKVGSKAAHRNLSR